MRRDLAIGAVLLAAGTTCSAVAQDSSSDALLEEIIVTAQKRSENLQSTPIAITAFSADSLERLGVTDVSDVVRVTPTLYSQPYPTSSSTLFVFMRGQGIGDPMQITKDGSIGLYVDGIYSARPQAAAFDLADVERIEVLRGPQGTLYGRNTTGGAVNIISKKPTGELHFRSSLLYGSRHEIRSLTNLDLPAFGDFSVKLTGLVSRKDGYVKNIGSGHDYNESGQVSGKAAVRWKPNDNVTADYSLNIGKVTTTPIYFSNPSLSGVIPGYEFTRYRTWRPVDLPLSKTRFRDHSLVLEWQSDSALTLRSLTGYRELKPYIFDDFAEAFGFPFALEDKLHSRQLSEDVQLVGSAFGDRVEFAAGLFFFRERVSHLENVSLAGAELETSRDVNAISESKAIYGQATWTPPILSDRLSVTAGGRYTWDDRRATRNQSANGFAFEAEARNVQHFQKFNPAGTVSYKVTDEISAYGRIATGYKAGGSSESATDFTRTFGPETVKSYELGIKSDLLDRRLRLNVAAFHSDFRDAQLDVSTDPTDPSVGATINAGKVAIDGAEVDLTWAVSKDLTLGVSYAYLQPDVKSVAVPGTLFNGSANLAPLFTIPYAPKHSVTISGDWTALRFDGGDVAAHIDYSYKGRVYQTADAGPAVVGRDLWITPSYGMLNARLTVSYDGFRGAPLQLSLWGRNITDSRHVVQKGASGSQRTGYTSDLFSYAEPASFGVEVSVDF